MRLWFDSWVRKTYCSTVQYPTPGFLCGSAGKESAYSAGHLGSIPGLGRSPGEGKGYSVQYSGLENFMDCRVRGVAKRRTRLSDFTFTQSCLTLCDNHGLQHTRLPCATPRAYSKSCPLRWWYHPTISFSVIPFSSCLQCFPSSGSFQISSSHQVATVLELRHLSFYEYSQLIFFRIDWFDLAVQGTLKSLLQHHSLKASILRCSVFFMVQLTSVHMTIATKLKDARFLE